MYGHGAGYHYPLLPSTESLPYGGYYNPYQPSLRNNKNIGSARIGPRTKSYNINSVISICRLWLVWGRLGRVEDDPGDVLHVDGPALDVVPAQRADEETPGHTLRADTVALPALHDPRHHHSQTHRALQLSHHSLRLHLQPRPEVPRLLHSGGDAGDLQFLLICSVIMLLHSPADAGDTQVGGRTSQVSVERHLED